MDDGRIQARAQAAKKKISHYNTHYFLLSFKKMIRLFPSRRQLLSRLLSQGQCTPRIVVKHRSFATETRTGEKSRRGGGIFIGLGWTLLGLVALDQVLQYRQEEEAKEHMQMLKAMQWEADNNPKNQPDWDANLPTKFECKILRVEPSLDGPKMLRNIRVGDVVEIMEEGVGPHHAYHLCRLPVSGRRKESIGWYPIEYLENVNN